MTDTTVNIPTPNTDSSSGSSGIVLRDHADRVFDELVDIGVRSGQVLKQVPIVNPEAVNLLVEAISREPGMEEYGYLEYLAEAGQELIKALTLPQNPSQELLAEHAQAGLLALQEWDLSIEALVNNEIALSDNLLALNALTINAFEPLSAYLDPQEWKAFVASRNMTMDDINAWVSTRENDICFAKQRFSPSGS